MHILADDTGHDVELAALAHEARAGSTAAFDTLAGRVRARILAWARVITRDEDDADDVAQLVLLKLHAHVDRFEGRSRFTTWLYRITRNVAFSRRVRDRRREVLLATRGAGAPEATVVQPEPGDAAPDRLADLVWAYQRELPPRQRDVFELSELHGLTSAQIAEQLGVTPVTVRGLLMKARRRIRLRMLAEHADLLEDYTP